MTAATDFRQARGPTRGGRPCHAALRSMAGVTACQRRRRRFRSMGQVPSASKPPTALELLSQMVEDISGELALEPLLQRIVARACALIGADDGVIGLYLPDCDAIRTAASHNIPDRELTATVPRGYGLTGRVLELDAPYRGYYDDLPRPTRPAPAGMHVIGMPIRADGRLIGVFGIGRMAPRTLDAGAQELLDLFARHAAIAIGNARRYDQERRRASRFALISRVAAIIAAAPELDTLLQRAADAVHELLEYHNVDVALVEPVDPPVLVMRIRGGEYKRRIRHVDRLPFGAGIVGAAAQSRRTQLVNDVARDPRYVTPPGVVASRAELAVPIVHGDEVLGVLNVEGNHDFDELDCDSLAVVAEHLGLAIVNARLFERDRRVAVLEERQRLARDLHDNVTQILSSMSLITQSLADAWRSDPAEGERRAVRLGELARLGFAELRAMMHELSPDTSPLAAPVPQRLSARLHRLLHAMVPPYVSLDLHTGDCPPQAEGHEEAIVRVCQEAVSNAVRHAAPSRIRVSIAVADGELLLRVSDDGRGIDGARSGGMGLRNMHARLAELGGRLRISRRRPHGTLISAHVPRCDREQR